MDIEKWKLDYVYLLQSLITMPTGDHRDGLEVKLFGGNSVGHDSLKYPHWPHVRNRVNFHDLCIFHPRSFIDAYLHSLVVLVSRFEIVSILIL